jgi:hypothetical protein
VALILLRLCLAISLICAVFLRTEPPVSTLVSIIASGIAVAVLAGAMLPLCCFAAVALQVLLVRFTGWPVLIPVAINVLHAIALACLGAGAYSVDAVRYGRRLMILPRER